MNLHHKMFSLGYMCYTQIQLARVVFNQSIHLFQICQHICFRITNPKRDGNERRGPCKATPITNPVYLKVLFYRRYWKPPTKPPPRISIQAELRGENSPEKNKCICDVAFIKHCRRGGVGGGIVREWSATRQDEPESHVLLLLPRPLLHASTLPQLYSSQLSPRKASAISTQSLMSVHINFAKIPLQLILTDYIMVGEGNNYSSS